MRTEQEKTQEIIKIADGLEAERSRNTSGMLLKMADAALQRFEPGGRENVPRLYNYFQNCINDGVPLEAIREVIRIVRS